MGAYSTVLLMCAAGCLPAWIALRRHGVHGGLLVGYTVGFGLLVGQGLASLQVFYWRLAGLAAPGIVAFLALTALVVLLTWWSSSPPADAGPRRPSRAFGVLDAVAAVAFLATVVVVVQGYHAFTAQWPEGGWDAVGAWNLRAKSLFHGYDHFPELLGLTTPGAMPHYPLLLPGLLAAQYFWAGREMAAVPQVMSLLNVLGSGMLLCTWVADWSDRRFGVAAAVLFWSAMPLWLGAFGQGADVLVAYALLAAFAVMTTLLPGASVTGLPAGLGGFALGLLVWTKLEGLPLAVVLTVGYAATAWYMSPARMPYRQMAWLGAAAVPGVCALVFFRACWMSTSAGDMYLHGDWVSRITSLDRWWLAGRWILQRPIPVDASHGWWYSWSALAGGVAVGMCSRSWWRDPVVGFWALSLTATIAFWLVSYAATPFPLEWQLASSLDRLMLQAYPLTIAGVIGRLGIQFETSRPW